MARTGRPLRLRSALTSPAFDKMAVDGVVFDTQLTKAGDSPLMGQGLGTCSKGPEKEKEKGRGVMCVPVREGPACPVVGVLVAVDKIVANYATNRQNATGKEKPPTFTQQVM